MNSPPDAAPLLALQPSPRLPVLFVGHGSPMNAIEQNAWHHTWRDLGRDLGRELLARPVRPQLILCISAHWLTRGGWWLTGMARPRTLHDFSGFPRILFEQQYPAPGAPAVARALAAQLRSPATGKPLGVDEGGDENEWGLVLSLLDTELIEELRGTVALEKGSRSVVFQSASGENHMTDALRCIAQGERAGPTLLISRQPSWLEEAGFRRR